MRDLEVPSLASNSMRIALGLFVIVLLVMDGKPARANQVIYTETGTSSGLLGSTPFTNAAITLRTVSDTANITGGGFTYFNAGVSTVTISGLGTSTFTTNLIRAFAATQGPNNINVGIAYDTVQILSNYGTASGYDLSSSITMTGAAVGGGGFIPTSNGSLLLYDIGNTATFTAVVVPASVPEPASVISGLIGVVASVASTRKRRRGVNRGAWCVLGPGVRTQGRVSAVGRTREQV